MPDVARDDRWLRRWRSLRGAEREAHYIMVTVTDEYDPMFPALGMGTKLDNGNYLVIAEAGMRTK